MLSNSDKRILANHEKRLAMPKWKFILIYGVLAWGVLTAFMFTAMSMMITKRTFAQMMEGDLWINLILFPLGGVLYGWLMHKFMLRQVRRLKEKEGA